MQSEAIKVLIVEDEPHIGELLARFLAGEGYACKTVNDGEAALRLLQAESFELVITDIMMPGLSGMDLLHIIKTLYPDTAVLMVTSVSDHQTGVLAIELGAYGYVIKPFERNEILINVASALDRRRHSLACDAMANKDRPRPKLITRRQDPIKIPAREAVQHIRSGMDDSALMKKFNLSAKALDSLIDQLIAQGYLKQSEVDGRGSLSPGTVVLDAEDLKFPAPDKDRPSINAKDAIRCLKMGMDDSSLMNRYRISAKGLRSLFRKLVASGLIDQSELDRRMTETHNWAVLEDHG